MSEWKHISEVTREVESYLNKRRRGEIKSLRSGFRKLDSCNIDGFEWGSTVTIGGRPSVGKSAYSDCLVRGFFRCNEDFDLLDFNWEMSARALMLRNLSSDMRQSYRYLCSAEGNTLSEREMQDIERLLKEKYDQLPVYYVERPKTPRQFADTVRRFRDERKRRLVVRVDHTILARIGQEDKDRVTMLLNLMGEANEIKRESDVVFLFLTQMNREFETRQKDNDDGAYPLQSDVFGGDAAAMYSETMILLNRPQKYNIRFYGSRRGQGRSVDPHDVFAHIVKSRNAPPDSILTYSENFAHMDMQEV